MSVLRWGLIGAGDIVRRRVADALKSARGCELVAVARNRANEVDAFAREIGARRGHASWRDLVTDRDVDAVYVATPVALHAAQTIAAAEAGRHVLCEKPMAMDVGECDRMIAACRANGVRLGVAYYRRFYPVVARIRDILAAGEVGTPVFAEMQAFEPFDPAPDAPRSWLIERAQSGGGPMADFGCHRIEVLLHLFGPVRRVTSLVATVALHRDVEDTAAALLQFARGTCAALTVTHAAAERRDTFELFGTRGSIRAASLNAGEIVVSAGSASRHETHPPPPNVHLPLIDDFAAAIRGGRDPAVDGTMGRAVAIVQGEIYADTPSVR
jgi:predicted dehydrogenase